MTTVTKGDLDTLISLLNNLRLSRYFSVAAATVFFYDVSLTIDEEVKFIWSKGKTFSWGKILYLAIRYYTIASALVELWVTLNTNPSKQVCRIWYQWQTVSVLVVLTMTEVVLLLRIWALYGQSRKIIVFTAPLFLAFVGGSIGLVYLSLKNINAIPASLIPGTNFCVPFSTTQWNKWATWIPIIGIEAVLFALSLLKGYQYLLRRFRLGWSDNSLLDVLIRDSIVYYFANFVTHVASLVIWSINVELLEVPADFAVVMPVVMSLRLLINIRKTHYNGTTLRTISEFNAQNPSGIHSPSDPELSNPV